MKSLKSVPVDSVCQIVSDWLEQHKKETGDINADITKKLKIEKNNPSQWVSEESVDMTLGRAKQLHSFYPSFPLEAYRIAVIEKAIAKAVINETVASAAEATVDLFHEDIVLGQAARGFQSLIELAQFHTCDTTLAFPAQLTDEQNSILSIAMLQVLFLQQDYDGADPRGEAAAIKRINTKKADLLSRA